MEKNGYILGIDSGATKTKFSLVSPHGILIHHSQMEGFNLHIHPLKKFRTILEKILQEIHKSTQVKEIKKVVIGVAGAYSREGQRRIEKIVKKTVPAAEVVIYSDVELIYEVAKLREKREFILLISGTGSIAYYKDEKGKIKRKGGYGFPVDLGSASWLGVQGFIFAIKNPDSNFSRSLLGGRDPREFVSNLKSSEDWGKLAIKIMELENIGDPHAKRLLEQCVDELMWLLEGVFPNKKLGVVFTGGMFKNPKFTERFVEKCFALGYPFIKPLDLETSYGIALVALRMD